MKTITGVTDKVLDEIQEELEIRHNDKFIGLAPFGSQTAWLIAMVIERIGLLCPILNATTITPHDIVRLQQAGMAGLIYSGGPASVYDRPPKFDNSIIDLDLPQLGICYGWQLGAQHFGYKVELGEKREFGPHDIQLTCKHNPLFAGIPEVFSAIQNHGDRVIPDEGLEILALSKNAVAAGRIGNFYGVQFHPEVADTEYGEQILRNFATNVCGITNFFPASEVSNALIEQIRRQIGDERVLMLTSGGVDSSVALGVIRQALYYEPGRIVALYIEGLDRPDDRAHVLRYFGNLPDVELVFVDATERFLTALAGKTAMQDKRLGMIGGYTGIVEEMADMRDIRLIGQGTLHTDLVESGKGIGDVASATIKVHHNTQGFALRFEEVLPLADQVKDTGRAIGRQLGVPNDLIERQPFPGPGLSLRIEGEVTAERLEIARTIDSIYIGKMRQWGLYGKIWQAAPVLTLSRTNYLEAIEAGAEFPTEKYDPAYDIAYGECFQHHLEHPMNPRLTITRSVTTCVKGDGAATGVVAAISNAGLPQIRNWALLKRIATRLTDDIREIGAIVALVGQRDRLDPNPGAMVALWAVDSVNGFTATASEVPWDFLEEVRDEIFEKVSIVGSVVYVISGKPPRTIEWG